MKNEPNAGPVLRVRITWKDGQWTLVKVVSVPEMTIPRTETVPEERQARRIGMWFHAVDAKTKVIYRGTLPTPQPGIEIFDRSGRIRRVPTECGGHLMDILIPDLPEIVDVQLFWTPGPHCPEDIRRKMPKSGPVATFRVRDPKPARKPSEGR
jgi:hypothetical protein